MKQKKLKEEEVEQIKKTVPEASEEKTKDEAVLDQPEEAADKEVEELRKQSEDNYNRLLRMQADFDNYKKRVAKERDDMYYNALETIAGQLLPVVDNMERAVEAFRKDQLDEKYICGVEMVFKQIIDVLDKNGIKEIEALEKDFDPNLHHAVMRAPGEDKDENKVKEVFQKGYILGNKVIRPTLVKVSVKQ
ncbi:MAG: nucleotide exchange factor GrpE [Clostridiaceae bacterium]|nr:nucleotide exchange factor GrpE [Clostridia bacterium]MDD4503348.1 nucleotide exchange factor GrpE [Clostridiaceae bacterium]